MSKRDTFLLLDDMLNAAEKINTYTKELSFELFINDDKTIDAVIRNFSIIGEAANRINETYKLKNPNVEWRRIIGLRNRMIHDYFGIDHEILWLIIKKNISPLIIQLKSLLNNDE